MHRPLGRWPAQPILVSGVSDLSCVRSEDESGRETLGRPGATVSGRRGRRRRRVIRTNRAVLPWIRPVAPWLLEAFPTGHSIPREYRGIVSIPPTAQSPLLPARPISRPFWNPAKLRRWQAGGLNPNRPPSRFAPRVVHLCHAITTTTTTTTTTIDTPCAVLPARACFCCCRRLPDAARRAAADSACALLATLTPLSLLLSPPYRASAARRPPAPPPACVGCRLSPVLSPIAHRPARRPSPVARSPVTWRADAAPVAAARSVAPSCLPTSAPARLHVCTFPVRHAAPSPCARRVAAFTPAGASSSPASLAHAALPPRPHCPPRAPCHRCWGCWVPQSCLAHRCFTLPPRPRAHTTHHHTHPPTPPPLSTSSFSPAPAPAPSPSPSPCYPHRSIPRRCAVLPPPLLAAVAFPP